jgi:hypothetical protein
VKRLLPILLVTLALVGCSGSNTSPAADPWTRSGQGNDVFDMPSYVTRVRIQGTWNRTDPDNFIVKINGTDVVNEHLTSAPIYNGVHLTAGGVVEIIFSTNVAWVFTEVR